MMTSLLFLLYTFNLSFLLLMNTETFKLSAHSYFLSCKTRKRRQITVTCTISFHFLFSHQTKEKLTRILSFTCRFCSMSASKHPVAHSVPGHALTRLAQEWLAEDTPNFDPAGVCVGSEEVEARLLCKTPYSILAGTPFFTAVFTEVGCSVEWIYEEGAEIGRHHTTPAINPTIIHLAWRCDGC